VDVCASPGHCNARDGRCEAGPCVDGATQCSGRDFQRCEDGRWTKVDECARASLCDHDDDAGCRPAVCEVTEYRCNGAELERCNVNGDGWIPVRTCASADLCSAPSKRCNAAVCAPGERRCDDESQLYECAPGRHQWLPTRDCTAGVPAEARAATPGGFCDPVGGCATAATCETGDFRCNAQMLERCVGGDWFPFAPCASHALCDATAGACLDPACEAGAARCATLGAEPDVVRPGESTLGLTLQVCREDRTGFDTLRDCGADELCDADHAQCDACDPLELFCWQGRLYLCSSDGQERELELECENGCGLVNGRPGCL
jgi:hypothetical protein